MGQRRMVTVADRVEITAAAATCSAASVVTASICASAASEYLPKGTVLPTHQPYLTSIAEGLTNAPALSWAT